MVKFFIVSVLLLTQSALASNKVVYGDDNRLDLVDVTNTLHKRLAASTAAMVENRQWTKDATGMCQLRFNETLEDTMGLCRGERFAEQPTGAMCSGFLIGEDTLVTAGHCLLMLGGMGYPTSDSVCRNFSWVFGYAIHSQGQDPRQVPAGDVYGCKQVIVAKLSRTEDFAVIKLDRKVTGRQALTIRQTGKVALGTELVVIGHPSGLPSKVADGAQVTGNNELNTFLTNLDTFQGNSGSAVFDSKTGMVEGILIQGQADYRPAQGSCQVVNHCDQNGQNCVLPSSPMAPKGEVVTRITQILPYLKTPARAPARVPQRRPLSRPR